MALKDRESLLHLTLEEAKRVTPLRDDVRKVPMNTLVGRRVRVGQLEDSDQGSLDRLYRGRRSERTFAPIELGSISTLLCRAGRTLGWSGGGIQRVHRPIPSAGGRATTELALAALHVEGLDTGWWRFDADRCDLVEDETVAMDALPGRLTSLLDGGDSPPAAIFVVGYFDRLTSGYDNGTSLLWREAGGALALLHLAAFDLGLASCILGSAGVAITRDDLWDLGCVAIGGRSGTSI